MPNLPAAIHQNQKPNSWPEDEVGLAAIIDVETTGLSKSDKIVELAVCLFSFHRGTGEILGIVEEYSGLQDPKIPIPERVSKIHGLRNDDVSGKQLDKKQIKGLLDRAEFILAHNASFDKQFVTIDFPDTRKKTWLCTCWHISWPKRGFQKRSLEYLLQCHDIHTERRHRALDDVHATLELISLTDGNGTYFSELLGKAI